MANENKSRRIATFSQAALYTIIVIAILGVFNFIANRYNKSFDSTANKRYSLSDQTIKILQELKQPVTISYWNDNSAFPDAQGLFDRYKNISPSKVDVKYQDIDKKRTEAIAAGVKTRGAITVEVGNKREEAKSLTEEEVTGALVRALKGGDRTVCFVTGYGEGSPNNTDQSDGYSSVKDVTEKNNYKTQTLQFVPKAEIPAECTIIVVGGPKHDYLPPAVDAIKNYVENGGRALIMMDPPIKFGPSPIDDNSALVSVIDGWGIKLQKDLVLDLSGVGQYFNLGPQYVIITNYADHAIVKSMKEVAVGLPITRSMEVSKEGSASAAELFHTGDDSVATTNLNAAQIDPKSAKPGSRILAAAGTYMTGKENGNGRYVVIGTSRWVGNGFLGFNGNRDLYLNMLNWLSSDEDLISIRPKDPEDRRLNMNARQVALMFYSTVLGLPLVIVLLGVSVWWKRR